MAIREEIKSRIKEIAATLIEDSDFTADIERLRQMENKPEGHPEDPKRELKIHLIQAAFNDAAFHHLQNVWGNVLGSSPNHNYIAEVERFTLYNDVFHRLSCKMLFQLRQEFPEAAATVAAQKKDGEIAAEISPKNTISLS